LRLGDLYEPGMLEQKLFQHFEKKQRQAHAILNACEDHPLQKEVWDVYESFMRQVRLKDVLAAYQQFAGTLPVTVCTDAEFLAQAAGDSGDIIFEGAHAALLDRDHGYFPYVAKTDTTSREAMNILNEANFDGSVFTLGVVRALGYRHGPGPFVTEDGRLSGTFLEKHNKANDWQGNVRYGWFDLLAIRHGMRLNSPVNGIALTMLDHLPQVGSFQVCLSYEYCGQEVQSLDEYFDFVITETGRVKILDIKPVLTGRTDKLSRLLLDCIPWDWMHYKEGRSAVNDFIRFLESPQGLHVPVQIISTGPGLIDKDERVAI
jgi:adenylosuccinate synthase